MGDPQVKVISTPKQEQDDNRQTGRVENNPENQEIGSDNFLEELADTGVQTEQLRGRLRSCLGEVANLKDQNKWDDIITLLHPLEEKEPELVEAGLDKDLRLELGFALGQKKYFDEAVRECEKCLEHAPDDFRSHSSLAYHLYNSLFAAKNKEILLTPESRKERISKAHEHFSRAQELRPDQVTNYYREGMLYKTLENKPDKALPLFSRAVENWDNYTSQQKEYRQQERKNFIKALYNLGSCQSSRNKYSQAFKNIKRCLQEDEKTDYLHAVYKYFALGKVNFQLGDYNEALSALNLAIQFTNPRDGDYVFELSARTHLLKGEAEKGLEHIKKIPVKNRRPYVRWTESDILVSVGREEEAVDILHKSAERDRRSRHRSLVRLARIYFKRKDYQESYEHARQANDFHLETFSTPDPDGMFWVAASLLMQGKVEEASNMAKELEDFKPDYPYLVKLKEKIENALYSNST